jgi:diketogulonate reductase-like aldo/keto reductase
MPWPQFLREFEKHGNFADCGVVCNVVCKGAIPVPTPKNKEQVDACLQALGWRLSKNDEDRLDALGVTNAWDWNLIKHFQNWWWQQG